MSTSLLLILDGYGVAKETLGNAIKSAKTPTMDELIKNNLYLEGYASGLEVGLPKGQMGNSEVGHLNIGAGRVVYQDLTKINKSIEEKTFFKNKEFLDAIENCKTNNSSLHLLGLLSDGGVHSHNLHLYALLELAKMKNLKKVYVHPILDGRDTPPTSGENFIKELEQKMDKIGVGEIASISGRYYALDRDNRWDRVEKAYNCIVLGQGESYKNPQECIRNNYSEKLFDEFILPATILNGREEPVKIDSKDSVILFNFRPDRAREITRTLCEEDFKEFKRQEGHICPKLICFTDYDKSIKNKSVAFKKDILKNTLGEYISSKGLKQLRIAETEKYAHVTFFLNGGREENYDNEDRILINSPKVATYNLKPEMSIYEVTEQLVKNIESDKYDLIVANFANPDMVGHTGDLVATIEAVEHTDKCVRKVYESILKSNGNMFICADHGNADKVIDYDTKKSFTSHTSNPVPFIVINAKGFKGIKSAGRLSDVAPTILDMLELDKPKEMSGESLLIK